MQPKYRAWYKDKMWKVETIFINEKSPDATRIRVGFTDSDGKYEWEFPFQKDIGLMHFVGLDKNGNDIFESDVVSYRYMGVTVHDSVDYRPERAGFEPFIGVVRGPEEVHMNRVEVIGNLYQNKDLFVEAVTKVF